MTQEFTFEIQDGKKKLIKYTGSNPNVVIPDDVDIIREGAFKENQTLISVVISEGVTEIGWRAFAGCTNLSLVEIPVTVREIGGDAFSNTPFFNNLPGDFKISGCFLLAYTGQDSKIQIPPGVSIICHNAFYGRRELTSVVLPQRIKAINSSAFKSCWNLKELGVFYQHGYNPITAMLEFNNIFINILDQESRQIGKLYLLDSGEGMLYNEFFRRLIGGSVEHLSEYDALFSLSDEIIVRKFRVAICRLQHPLELEEKFKQEYIFYLKNNVHYTMSKFIREGDIAPISHLAGFGAIPEDGINSWIDLANELSRLEILAYLLDYKHKSWGKQPVFTLEQVIDSPPGEWTTQENPDGSLNIIRYTGSQQSVTIPALIEGKKVKRIEGRIGSLKISIFFQNKELVKSIIIEDGIEIIAERAFLECGNLMSIEIPESIERIGTEAFSGCSGLGSVVIPRGVNEIGERAFENCTNLTIYAPKDSYAIEHAKKNDIKYVEI